MSYHTLHWTTWTYNAKLPSIQRQSYHKLAYYLQHGVVGCLSHSNTERYGHPNLQEAVPQKCVFRENTSMFLQRHIPFQRDFSIVA